MSLPKVFFEVPYPNPPISYYDLPQSVRDQWAAWAKANPLGWLDYHYEIRQAPDAYYICTVSDMMVNSGVTAIYNPPQWVPRIRPAIDGVEVNVTIGDTLSVRTSRYLSSPVTIAIWATATNPAQANVNNQANKFIGSFKFPTGTPSFSSPDDLGPQYAAAFATLAADLGDYLSVWCWVVSSGSMQYVAGYSSVVTTVAWADQGPYWPLNEAAGTRRSITQPCDLLVVATPTQVAGPIDYAVRCTTTQGLASALPAPDTLSPGASEFSLCGWFWVHNTGLACVVVKGTGLGASEFEWWIGYDGSVFTAYVTDGSGPGNAGMDANVFGTPSADTWHYVVAVFAAGANNAKIYVDGMLDSSYTVTYHPTPNTTFPLRVNRLTTPAFGGDAAYADVTLFTRPLSAAEVTALYNAGAGLRYPYQ